ncbi:unnamed protein product, partial [Brassica rapa]
VRSLLYGASEVFQVRGVLSPAALVCHARSRLGCRFGVVYGFDSIHVRVASELSSSSLGAPSSSLGPSRLVFIAVRVLFRLQAGQRPGSQGLSMSGFLSALWGLRSRWSLGSHWRELIFPALESVCSSLCLR